MNTLSKKSGVMDFFFDLDFATIITAIIASAYGLTLVYSATYSSLSDGEFISGPMISMLITVLGGIVIALGLSMINYEIITGHNPKKAKRAGLLHDFGVAPSARDTARSWLKFGSFTFQTSELLKVGFIISFSYHLDMVKDKLNKLKTIIPLVIHGAIPVGLVILTGDAGSALIFLFMFIGMLFFAKVNIGYFVAGLCAMIVGFAVAWRLNIINGIQRQRIVALFYPEQYEDVMYQQEHGKIALGSGGMFGTEMANSADGRITVIYMTQKAGHFPKDGDKGAEIFRAAAVRTLAKSLQNKLAKQ